MKGAIYARYSTDNQSESSIADQVRVCTEYAGRNGLQIVETYEDQGISGAAFGNRPGALRMREAAMAGQFDVLLLADTTRLARSQELAPLVDRLRHRGVRVIGVQDGFDSSSSTADMQAGLSGILSVEFRRMIRFRTHAALESRAQARKPTGGRCYGFRESAVHEPEAAIVRRIFERSVAGASTRTIAAELNAEGVPSPGSSWNRTERRCRGWMGSCVRAMLRNARYTGAIHWNASEWVKDPDTGRRLRRERARSEWITHHDETLRIVSDELYRRAQDRARGTSDERLKSGGKARYLLSGLLVCDRCGAHYVLADARSYACSSHVFGRACDNSVRVRRDVVQSAILNPVSRDLLAPDRVQRMAREMQAAYAERVRAANSRAEAAPKELRDLDARIGRLRERLCNGDPDMEADEIQAGIDAAEVKRRELLEAQPAVRQGAKLLAMLPKAAELYRRQVTEGLDGNPEQALRARVLLRELLGPIRLVPEAGGGLWAEYEMHPEALLLQGAGTRGSGGRI